MVPFLKVRSLTFLKGKQTFLCVSQADISGCSAYGSWNILKLEVGSNSLDTKEKANAVE